MTSEYFSHRLGNAIVVFAGEYKLGEFWFKKDGESSSPLTEAEAETLANRFVDYLNKEHPIEGDEYGDSKTTKASLDLNDEIAQMIDGKKLKELKHKMDKSKEDSKPDLASLMLMAAMMGGGCK